jgi:hypothetical protein
VPGAAGDGGLPEGGARLPEPQRHDGLSLGLGLGLGLGLCVGVGGCHEGPAGCAGSDAVAAGWCGEGCAVWAVEQRCAV